VAWYDNEYGYTCNLIRVVKHVAEFKLILPLEERAGKGYDLVTSA
jgi:hypothetical protein